jgi:predicted phosphodiesterase
MGISTVVCVPDVHVPFHDRKAWELALKVIATVKPDMVIQLGDLADYHTLSAHAPEPGPRVTTEEEVEAHQEAVRELRSAHRPAQRRFLRGNHCYRLERLMYRQAPELVGELRSWEDRLGLEGSESTQQYRKGLQLGPVLYIHDLGHSGKQATQQNLDAAGTCVVTGHTHRAGIAYGGTVDGHRSFSMSCGWLGDPAQITYLPAAKMREWQHGVGLVQYAGGIAHATFVPFVKGRAVVLGHEVSVHPGRRYVKRGGKK